MIPSFVYSAPYIYMYNAVLSLHLECLHASRHDTAIEALRRINTNAHAYCVNRRQPPRQAEAIIVFVYTVTTFIYGEGHSPLLKPLPH